MNSIRAATISPQESDRSRKIGKSTATRLSAALPKLNLVKTEASYG